MTDSQVVDKFRGLAGRKLPPQRLERVLERIWKIDSDPNWPTLFEELRI